LSILAELGLYLRDLGFRGLKDGLEGCGQGGHFLSLFN
jgi:hypothetical protein